MASNSTNAIFLPLCLALLGIIVIPITITYFAESSRNYVLGIDVVEYKEEGNLYEGKESIYYNTSKESRFLSSVFGDVTINEVFVTKEDGNTVSIPLNMLSFKIGDSWRIEENGTHEVQKDGRIDNREVINYTIIGPKDELVLLSSDFAKTFKMTIPIE